MGDNDGGKPKQQHPPPKPPPKANPAKAKPEPGSTTEPVRVSPGRAPTRDGQVPVSRPGGARAGRPAESAFELTPVTSGPHSPTISDLKKVPSGKGPTSTDSDFQSGRFPARAPSVAEMRRITGHSSQELPKVGGAPKARPGEAPPAGGAGLVAPPQLKKPTVYQRQLQSSRFDEEERTQIDAVLGNVNRVELDADEEESTVGHMVFDGIEPAKDVTAPDAWKAVNAPMQSRPGRRSPRITWTVIDQFAVGHNPRYEPDAPGRPRAHLFVWDVSRAMGCEVPHFAAGREMSLGQTVDWIRLEGRTRGWRKLTAEQAVDAADRGELVLALPKDPKTKLVAVVRPGGAGDDGDPRVAGANNVRGNDLGAREALGGLAVEYWGHE